MREEEALVDEIERAQRGLRDRARLALGLGGPGTPPPGAGATDVYVVAALAVLAGAFALPQYGFLALGRTAESSIGASLVDPSTSLRILLIGAVGLPLVAVARRRRQVPLVLCALLVVASLVAVSMADRNWLYLVAVAAGAAGMASVHALHVPVLVDSYSPEARLRVLALYQAGTWLGLGAGALAVPALTLSADFTWRAVYLLVAVACLGAAVLCGRLREPGIAPHETARVAEEVRRETGVAAGRDDASPVLGFGEAVRRVALVPSARWLLLGHAALGMVTLPVLLSLVEVVEERRRVTAGTRGLFFVVLSVCAVGGLVLLARSGDARARRSVGTSVHMAAVLLAVGALAQAFGPFLPWTWAWFAVYGLAFAALAPAHVLLTYALLTVVPPAVRAHASALAGVSTVTVGGLVGLSTVAAIGDRFGSDLGLALLVPGALHVASLLAREAVKEANHDVDRTVDELVEHEYVRSLVTVGRRLPLLACRRVDYAYGPVQVLFGVNFTVDDGEMVALLGTNGAGKSTLLRVISGLGLPSAGSVRFGGEDISYFDAERRVPLGIAQVTGGRAVFGPLTVAENLRVIGHTHGRNRRAVEAGIEASFEAFPRLAERRNQRASTLSGGEQQMLALSKALILQPRLLLIDELSLGLAPKVVGELLEMVRRINATGTAIVLVEQSVNIASSLVHHAYFMEKGQIQFDGAADELLTRSDLLRSVFLEGAARGLGASGDAGR